MEEIKTADDGQFLETVSAWISREDHRVTVLANLSALIYHYLREHHKINTYYPNIC